MHSWAEEELKDTGLPDQRLNRRLIKIVAQAVQQPYYVRGLKVHSSLMVSTEGVPLGISDLQIWTREPTKKNKKDEKKIKKSIGQKESKRWLRGLVDAELAVIEIVLPKTEKRMGPKAVVTIRFTKVKILAPQNLVGKTGLESVSVNAISVIEENPPTGEKGIQWRLLTTLPITHYQDVLTYIKWYGYRWLIERYHYVLKSGCGVEKL